MTTKLTYWDFEDAAKEIGCSVAMIKAFALTESGGRGGFDSEGRLLIRYEGHKFRDYTDHKYDAEHPKVSYKYHKSHKSCGKYHSYNGFNIAFSLVRRAALLACSLGMFQPMGFNYEEMGYDSVEAMWDDFRKGERNQLMAFVRLVKRWGLADEMRNPSLANCRILAKTYNGADYEANNYHNKIWDAYKKYSKEKPPTTARPLIIGEPVITPILETAVAIAEPVDPKEGSWTEDQPKDEAKDQPNNAPAVPPAPETNKVEVDQVKPEVEEPKEVSGIGASIGAAVTFVTTTCAGLLSWIGGAKTEIIYGFFGAAALVGTVFIINRFWYANKEKQRAHEERMDRERRAHELQMATVRAASDPNMNTVIIKPQPIQNSEPAIATALASPRKLSFYQRLTGNL